MSAETWTPDRVDLLKKLLDGGLSSSQIASELGGALTRNAVIGKVLRLGLAFNNSRGAKPREQTVKPRLGVAKRHAVFDVRPAAEDLSLLEIDADPVRTPVSDAPAGGVDHDGLKPHHCRWPSGDPRSSDFRYCGSPRVEGKPYCAPHVERAKDPNRKV